MKGAVGSQGRMRSSVHRGCTSVELEWAGLEA